MPPIISVVGRSKSGKTTVVEKLVAELKRRNYRVASIKHAREIHFEPGKDSERHLAAGSEAVAVVTDERLIMIKPVAPGTGLDELARSLGEDYDIIIIEGFKQEDVAKIEVHRATVGPPLENLKRVTAIITDEPLKAPSRQFSFEDTEGLADLVEQGFIAPQSQRLALYINGEPLPLTIFPRRAIAGLLLGMVSSLKGVAKVNSLMIWLKNPRDE